MGESGDLVLAVKLAVKVAVVTTKIQVLNLT